MYTWCVVVYIIIAILCRILVWNIMLVTAETGDGTWYRAARGIYPRTAMPFPPDTTFIESHSRT